MRKIITLVRIIVVAAIAIAWSTHDRRQTARQPAEATATMEPHDIMFTIGRRLPAESWVDPF